MSTFTKTVKAEVDSLKEAAIAAESNILRMVRSAVNEVIEMKIPLKPSHRYLRADIFGNVSMDISIQSLISPDDPLVKPWRWSKPYDSLRSDAIDWSRRTINSIYSIENFATFYRDCINLGIFEAVIKWAHKPRSGAQLIGIYRGNAKQSDS